jgi:hypothetical protein
MIKEYTCEIDLKFSGNNFEATSKDEYIKKVKQSFLEEFGIRLQDYEIKKIESEE